MKKKILLLLCFIAAILIIKFPTLVTNGVIKGIKLSLYSVIPSLLPFMLMCNILVKYDLCNYISYFLKPVLGRLFPVSGYGIFSIIIGFTCGYPLGAKTVGDLYKKGKLNLKEACYLATFTNNCSLSFLINYICLHCLHISHNTGYVIFLVYASPLIVGIVNGFFIKKYHYNKIICQYDNQQTEENPIITTIRGLSVLSVYIIIFSIVANILSGIDYISLKVKGIIIALTEISTGAVFLSDNFYSYEFLILFFTIFGGICIMFQAFEGLTDYRLKKYYIIGKLESLIIYTIIYWILT